MGVVVTLDAVKLMSHSGQAAVGKLASKSTGHPQPDLLLKDWKKIIQELGKV